MIFTVQKHMLQWYKKCNDKVTTSLQQPTAALHASIYKNENTKGFKSIQLSYTD